MVCAQRDMVTSWGSLHEGGTFPTHMALEDGSSLKNAVWLDKLRCEFRVRIVPVFNLFHVETALVHELLSMFRIPYWTRILGRVSAGQRQ